MSNGCSSIKGDNRVNLILINMLNKILTVTTLILLIWLSNESLKTKKINMNLNSQLSLIQEQILIQNDKNEKANQNIESLLDQISQKLKKNKQVKKKHKSKPKKKAPVKDLHKEITTYLKDIDKQIKDKKLTKALSSLGKLKKLLWNERNNKKVKKDKVLSILSSIDILQKKIKAKDSKSGYDTKSIKAKIKGLKLKGI